jgi:hypothetical protein
VDQHAGQQIAADEGSSPSATSGRSKLCLCASELGTVAWHTCICLREPPYLHLQCGLPIINLHFWTECSCYYKHWTVSWSENFPWHPNRWLTWICLLYQVGSAFCTYSIWFLSLCRFVRIVIPRISLSHTQPACILNSAFTVASF